MQKITIHDIHRLFEQLSEFSNNLSNKLDCGYSLNYSVNVPNTLLKRRFITYKFSFNEEDVLTFVFSGVVIDGEYDYSVKEWPTTNSIIYNTYFNHIINRYNRVTKELKLPSNEIIRVIRLKTNSIVVKSKSKNISYYLSKPSAESLNKSEFNNLKLAINAKMNRYKVTVNKPCSYRIYSPIEDKPVTILSKSKIIIAIKFSGLPAIFFTFDYNTLTKRYHIKEWLNIIGSEYYKWLWDIVSHFDQVLRVFKPFSKSQMLKFKENQNKKLHS